LKGSKEVTVRALLKLSHELGCEDRGMAILGEGNCSAGLRDGRFLVKASGSMMRSLARTDLVECRADVLLALLEKAETDDASVNETLLASRVDEASKKPSVEAVFHAYCLSLDGVHFVGHTHASAVNSILCSPRAREYAERRLFPDEIVCCGPASVFVPYTDPGLPLAREIRSHTAAFVHQYGQVPRVILIQNHGIITIGRTPESVLAAMLMAEKAATIWLGAASLGGPTLLSPADVDRIANRSDEAYRRRSLNI
jgi:rhamnose utilization protein RhaD (predicted bifunctional aldolase and dehydrogenase)